MTMTPDEAIALAKRLVDEIEREMLGVDPEREPFALVLLTAERADALELRAQTERRAAAKMARLADAEPRGEAERPGPSRAALWAE
jgi:hypothetical protein